MKKKTNFVSNVRFGENWFYGGNKKDTYTSSTSSDNFVDESKTSNDVYNITDLTSDTWIWDQGGHDTLNLTVAEGDQCNLYFKVELPKDTNWYGSPLNIIKYVDGEQMFNPEYAEESICFCNNESLEALFGGVTIADFFGDGYIEKVNINGHSIEGMAINSEFNFMTWIEFVEMGVQSWLQYDMGGVYASSDEVIARGTADEIAGLVAAYQKANNEFLYGPQASEIV